MEEGLIELVVILANITNYYPGAEPSQDYQQ